MVRRIITYALTAVLAALYWVVAGSVCYRLTGVDPRAIFTTGSRSGAAAAAVLALFVILFALIGHGFERGRKRRAGPNDG